MEPMILDRPRDDKYIVFKRDEFFYMLNSLNVEHENAEDIAKDTQLDDAVVIRRRDIFAAPALEAYANNILAAIEVVKAVTPGADAIKNLQQVADYFQWQAAAAWADTDQHIPD